MSISQDQLVGLSKQVFMVDYLLNGLFPCNSDIVKTFRHTKREWQFNDKFEYRMLFAGTNTGGTLNSQVFKNNIGLIKPGTLTYGTYHASYGTIQDGFDIDMMLNLETERKEAAFNNDYSTRLHSTRMNMAAMFKNFAIHGRFGVVHQLRASLTAPVLNANMNPVANVGYTPLPNTPFTIKVPQNVFQTNFQTGRYLIKTQTAAPWGTANVSELYMILDNQPGYLSLLSVGTTITPLAEGEFFELQGNREIGTNTGSAQVNPPQDIFLNNWSPGSITVPSTSAFAGVYDGFTYGGDLQYTSVFDSNGAPITGAMEGLPDLFPWYTPGGAIGSEDMTRLGLDTPFRDQPNRLMYSTQQAGGWVVQQENEHIIDVIMRGSFLTKATVPYADIGVWINPATRARMGYEEGDNVRVLRDNFVAGPIVYQRGVKTTDYQIGNQVVREVVEDLNMPTDVIVIGPKDDITYNCWDNSIAQIDDYIRDAWSNNPPPNIEDLAVPDEVMSKLDLGDRVMVGQPYKSDGSLASFTLGNYIRHPKNTIPIAMQENGALFTEYPYTYTVCKLRQPIADITVS